MSKSNSQKTEDINVIRSVPLMAARAGKESRFAPGSWDEIEDRINNIKAPDGIRVTPHFEKIVSGGSCKIIESCIVYSACFRELRLKIVDRDNKQEKTLSLNKDEAYKLYLGLARLFRKPGDPEIPEEPEQGPFD